MHELSLCHAIAATVSEHAAGRPVHRIRLRVGHFRQVVPETLQFCWEARAKDSNLAGCELEVIDVPAVVRCRECDASTTLDQPILRCDACSSRSVDLVSGEEFLIESIDVGDGVAASASATQHGTEGH